MIEKIFVAKTSCGTYYVQRMPGYCGIGVRYVLFKDRRQCYYTDFRDEKTAIGCLLEMIRREVVAQNTLDLY